MSHRGAALALVAALACGTMLAGCASGTPRDSAAIAALRAQARPIGRGPRFREPARGNPTGRCERRLGAREDVHVELFAENRVVLLAGGIGVRGPVRRVAGRIAGARCFGALVTLDPTGIVLVRPGTSATLATLFRAWGQPLSRARLASFTTAAPGGVRTYVNGRVRRGDPRRVPLRRHAEIVLEVGPHVPPHHGFDFPPRHAG